MVQLLVVGPRKNGTVSSSYRVSYRDYLTSGTCNNEQSKGMELWRDDNLPTIDKLFTPA